MGFFTNVISGFREAAKAGAEFNPTLDSVLNSLEQLQQQGHLDQVVSNAEQAYVAEHSAYKAKGIHTDAADSQRDVAALKHFMAALESASGSFESPVKEQVAQLLEMYDKMQHILRNAFQK